jgi:hypothetical protein
MLRCPNAAVGKFARVEDWCRVQDLGRRPNPNAVGIMAVSQAQGRTATSTGADGSLQRCWEFAIPVTELGATFGEVVAIDVWGGSGQPRFSYGYRGRHELSAVVAAADAPGEGAGASSAAQWRILANGALEGSFPDGTRIVRQPSGTITTYHVDGTISNMAFQESPAPTLPELPPGDPRLDWLNRVNDELGRIIELLLSDASADLQYLREIEADKNIFERIDIRTEAINFMCRIRP